jgi:coenzyme Q-binding protein COQ10
VPTHKEVRVVSHSPQQLYGLVADIEKYPDFLPWCVAARICQREPTADGELITVDMVLGFKMFREKVTSKVTLHPPDNTAADGSNHGRIDVEYVEGPLKYLQNHWVFVPADGGGCEIDFFVDFEFHSRLLQKIVGALFHEAVSRMVAAFERRATVLYGSVGE